MDFKVVQDRMKMPALMLLQLAGLNPVVEPSRFDTWEYARLKVRS
jgi:hypothetical protein